MAKGKHSSPTSRAWQRFRKNIPAILGLGFIILSSLVAVLGYLITPDQTPHANDQILQITNESPGFKIDILKRRKNRKVEPKSFFGTMLYGRENPYELIPITGYQFEGSNIVVEEYTGDEGYANQRTFSLADIAYPLSIGDPSVSASANEISFRAFDEEVISLPIDDLKRMVEEEHISPQVFYLGTDRFGRDILSRLMIGVRVSLSVGLIAVLISLIIGVTIGALAGYFRGVLDDILMWFINVVWSIPTLLLVFAITLALGKGFWQIFIAVGLTMWVEVARIIRGQVLSLREMQFVEAARSLAYNHSRTIMLHILPNTVGPLSVIAAANFAAAILIEAGLTFLGIGVQPPTPSWGGMLAENYGYIIGSNPLLAIFPGLAIMLMVLAFNLVGNGLRDAMDVRTSL